MSASAVARVLRRLDLASWRPHWTALLWMLGAFLLGWLLFAWLTREAADAPDPHGLAPIPPTASQPAYAPLPAPMPASPRTRAPATPDGDEPESPLPPPRIEAPAPRAPQPIARPATPPRSASTEARPPRPVATPAPRYPPRALRRGETGTVMVRAEVGPDGRPRTVTVATSSGSRDLDRAAVAAVRRWRFEPATDANGPTSASVVIPVDFDP